VLHPFMSRVRRAMGAGAGRAIKAVPRVGYRLDVGRLESADDRPGSARSESS
jgi:DNA-binding winged helix-turn-helix (wHTH) protein